MAHPQLNEAIQLAKQITSFLEERKIYSRNGLLYDQDLRESVKQGEFDILIALGGDGTMLRVGHLCGPSGIPILGINLGKFGFLMEVQDQQWQETLQRLLTGDYWLERRMMLQAEHWRGDKCLSTWQVINEAAVSRGQMLRPVHLDTYVDQRYLTTYVADGIIMATPTGSTAYALAAGGPILPPELRNILLVPVAPHLSLDRAIVLAEGSFVSVTLHSDHQAVFSVDGQIPSILADGDRVESRASEHTVQFIRFQEPDYFYRNLTKHMNQNPSIGNHR
jgi:NAD+ kinase